MEQHTKNKWSTEPRGSDATFGDYELLIDKAWVGRLFGPHARKRAEIVVKACNSYAADQQKIKDLVEALKKTTSALKWPIYTEKEKQVLAPIIKKAEAAISKA